MSSRTASPCSNICCFQADLAPGVNYVAFATSDGCIIVQQAGHTLRVLHARHRLAWPQLQLQVHTEDAACSGQLPR